MLITPKRFSQLIDDRARRPELVEQKAAERRRRAFLPDDGHLLLVAADHPARLILGVGAVPMAMADRRELLERTVTALRRPGVDGVMATPDIVEDLLLLDELHDKVVIGSMNRAGLTGAVWQLDDRFTAYDAEHLERLGLDGGKMLLRIDLRDAGTVETIEACAHAVTELARRRLIALVEPLPAHTTDDGTVTISSDLDELVGAIAVASALGATSSRTWLKLPASSDPVRMMAATTLPTLLLGGDPGADPEAVFSSWREAMGIPQVRGLVAGRSLLYPADGDVGRAVDAAASIVHGPRG